MSAGSGSPPSSSRRKPNTESRNPFDEVNRDALGHLFPFLGQVGTDNLSSTSTTMRSRPLEALKTIYTQHVSQHPGDYITAVRKITPALQKNQHITETFRTLILLPFTEDGVNVEQLSEEDEVLKYLLWLVRYKVHPVHVAYGLYTAKNYELFKIVCGILDNHSYEKQFELAVALMDKDAQDVTDDLRRQAHAARQLDGDEVFSTAIDLIVMCIVHKEAYRKRKVHHLDLSFTNTDLLRNQTCICYGENMVWFQDYEHGYLSRVTVDESDTIITRTADACTGTSFDVQHRDLSLSEINEVPFHDTTNTSGFIDNIPFGLQTRSRIVKCARKDFEIVIVLTKTGDICTHACGQSHHILQDQSPFVDLVYNYTSKTTPNLAGKFSSTAMVFALSAEGAVYAIVCTIITDTRNPNNNELNLECKQLSHHTKTLRVAQLAILRRPGEYYHGSWCEITLHHEGSLYLHLGGTKYKIASDVTLMPHLIYNEMSETSDDTNVCVVHKGKLYRVSLEFKDDTGSEINGWEAHEHDFTLNPSIESLWLDNQDININSIIEMVQDNQNTLYCLTSTGTVYKCDLGQSFYHHCSVVELPKDNNVIKTFKTRTPPPAAGESQDIAAMSELSLRLRLRL